MRTRDILGIQDLPVAETSRSNSVEEAKNRLIGLGAIWDQKVGVLGRPEVAMGDHGKASNDYVVQPAGIGVSDNAG